MFKPNMSALILHEKKTKHVFFFLYEYSTYPIIAHRIHKSREAGKQEKQKQKQKKRRKAKSPKIPVKKTFLIYPYFQKSFPNMIAGCWLLFSTNFLQDGFCHGLAAVLSLASRMIACSWSVWIRVQTCTNQRSINLSL